MTPYTFTAIRIIFSPTLIFLLRISSSVFDPRKAFASLHKLVSSLEKERSSLSSFCNSVSTLIDEWISCKKDLFYIISDNQTR